MPSAFFETPLRSLLTFLKVDTRRRSPAVARPVACALRRSTPLSNGYRPIVPIETCADKHESYHFANLTDMKIKYADVEPVQYVIDWLESRPDA